MWLTRPFLLKDIFKNWACHQCLISFILAHVMIIPLAGFKLSHSLSPQSNAACGKLHLGSNIYHVPVEGKEGVGEGKGVWFSKRLIWGRGAQGSILKMQKTRGGWNCKIQDLHVTFSVKVVNKLYYHWSKSTFPSRVLTVKKYSLEGFLASSKIVHL